MPAEKVSLNITVRYAADEDDLEDWRLSFKRASEILYYATDGQIQFGELFVEIDTSDTASADAFLYEHPGRSSGLYQQDMKLCRDEQVHPLVIVHEFGHLFFNLGDEYPTKFMPSAQCLGDMDLHACIMEWDEEGDILTESGIEEGKVREFCGDTAPIEHQPGNAQHLRHQCSCWEAIQVVRPDFDIPTPNRPYSTATPEGHDEPTWTVEETASRYVLVLENSAFANKVPFTAGQNAGAHFWVDLLALTHDSLGILGGDGSILFPLQSLDNDHDAQQARDAIDTLSFVAIPNVSKALATSLDQITPEGQLASTQATIMVTASNPAVVPPSTIDGQSMRALDTSAYPIQVGSVTRNAEWIKLAQVTKGEFAGIVGNLEEGPTEFQLQTQLIDHACRLQIGCGRVLQSEAHFSARETGTTQGTATSKASSRSCSPAHDQDVVHALIERGSQQAIFVLATDQPLAAFLEVRNPKGELVAPGKQVQIVSRDSYSLCLIDDPSPGVWSLRARPSKNGPATSVWIAAYSRNPRLFVRLKVWQSEALTIRFSATAFFDGPLAAIEPPVVTVTRESDPVSKADKGSDLQCVLTPRRHFDKANQRWFVHDETLYEGSIVVDQPGLYTVTARFVSAGTAVRCAQCCDTEEEPAESSERLVSRFVREVRQQFNVVGQK